MPLKEALLCAVPDNREHGAQGHMDGASQEAEGATERAQPRASMVVSWEGMGEAGAAGAGEFWLGSCEHFQWTLGDRGGL